MLIYFKAHHEVKQTFWDTDEKNDRALTLLKNLINYQYDEFWQFTLWRL